MCPAWACASPEPGITGPEAGSPSLPFTITDDQGQTISLRQPAGRILPLYGGFAEMLFGMGAGSRVVGRTQADRYPPELAALPSIGTHMRPDIEMVIGLKPDLVIVSASRKDEIAGLSRLAALGVPIAVFDPKSFDGIFSVISRIGILCESTGEAETLVSVLRKRLEDVRERLTGLKDKKKVFFEVRAEPLTGAGAGSIVNDVINAAGGRNVLGQEKGIVRFSLENLLFEDPDLYVVQEGPMNKSAADPAARAHFSRLRCIREGRIMRADEYVFSRPGPRSVEAVEKLGAALYPERFR